MSRISFVAPPAETAAPRSHVPLPGMAALAPSGHFSFSMIEDVAHRWFAMDPAAVQRWLAPTAFLAERQQRRLALP